MTAAATRKRALWRQILKIPAYIATLAALFGLTFVGWRYLIQAQTERANAIDTPAGIETLEKIRIGGIDQWVSIRGEDRRNPVLLYLHGGPGTPMMPFSHRFQRPWERYFTVVQWDQRGAGKTYFANDPDRVAPTMRFDRMVADGLELTLFLKKRFGTRKIFVLGHSWGSMLGATLVQRHPQHFYAYIGTGQVISTLENERLGYEHTLLEAARRNDVRALAELRSLAPYPDPATGTGDKIGKLREWQTKYGFALHGHDSLDIVMLRAGLESPAYSLRDLSFFFTDANEIADRLDPDVDAFDLGRFGARFPVPVFFLTGRHDWQTPAPLALAYYRRIDAPLKKFIWFEHSAHSPMFEEPDAYAKVLIGEVWPLADGPARISARR